MKEDVSERIDAAVDSVAKSRLVKSGVRGIKDGVNVASGAAVKGMNVASDAASRGVNAVSAAAATNAADKTGRHGSGPKPLTLAAQSMRAVHARVATLANTITEVGHR